MLPYRQESIFPDTIICMNGQNRADIKPGLKVAIVLKKDQRSGKLTEGIVADLLTKSAFHPHGIKVRLTDGQIGRVQQILE
jgi:uncharacterized repeat protein (TIGR03833 family)